MPVILECLRAFIITLALLKKSLCENVAKFDNIQNDFKRFEMHYRILCILVLAMLVCRMLNLTNKLFLEYIKSLTAASDLCRMLKLITDKISLHFVKLQERPTS